MHRDGGQQGVGGGGREPDIFGDNPGQARRGEGEVGVAGGVHQAGVVQERTRVQQLGVDVRAVELAQGATEDVGAVAVVQQRDGKDVPGALLGGSGQHAGGRGEAVRRQVGVAARVDTEGEPEPSDRVLDVSPGQRPQQRPAFGGGEPARGALHPARGPHHVLDAVSALGLVPCVVHSVPASSGRLRGGVRPARLAGTSYLSRQCGLMTPVKWPGSRAAALDSAEAEVGQLAAGGDAGLGEDVAQVEGDRAW